MMTMKEVETIMAFGQYLHWSELQYKHYQSLQEDTPESDYVGALAHWLASLYVVTEGWQQIGIPDPVLSDLVTKYDDYYQLLRRCRNGVYHFQPKLLSEKITHFLEPRSESVAWARALQFEFMRFLVCTVPKNADGEEMKLAIGWWPSNVLVRVAAARNDNDGELNPAMPFLSRLSRNV